MAQTNTKTRGIQLIRSDDSQPGIVRFYDRREENAQKALIGEVNLAKMFEDEENLAAIPAPIIRAAIHGYTQNILDSSNKLEGDERVAYVRKMCEVVQNGGWASAPVDEAALRQRAIDALMKLGMDRIAAERAAESATRK